MDRGTNDRACVRNEPIDQNDDSYYHYGPELIP